MLRSRRLAGRASAPQAWIEFDVESADAVAAAVAECGPPGSVSSPTRTSSVGPDDRSRSAEGLLVGVATQSYRGGRGGLTVAALHRHGEALRGGVRWR